MYNVNEEGINIIKTMEGFVDHPYKCSAGKWTIGYGHRLRGRVNEKMKITRDDAEDYLVEDLEETEAGVIRCLNGSDTTENQYSALVSFAFNLGVDALKKSSLLKFHNAGSYAQAHDEFSKWIYVTLPSGEKKSMKGLAIRRKMEADLYSKP